MYIFNHENLKIYDYYNSGHSIGMRLVENKFSKEEMQIEIVKRMRAMVGLKTCYRRSLKRWLAGVRSYCDIGVKPDLNIPEIKEILESAKTTGRGNPKITSA